MADKTFSGEDLLDVYSKSSGGERRANTTASENKSGEALFDTYSRPAMLERPDTADMTGIANAASGGFVRGIPIVGPYIDSGAQKAAAKIRSAIYGTPYDQELKAVSDYSKAASEEHPTADFLGQIGGAVTSMGALGAAAPSAMGLSGNLLTRVGAGGVSGGAINAVDSAVRSGGDPNQTMAGGAIGTAFGAGMPLLGKAVGTGVNKIMGTEGADAMTAYLSKRAADFGIPIRPPQMSDSAFVRKTDQMVNMLPGSGAAARAGEQQGAFNRAVASTFGEKADALTPDAMLAAKRRLGKEFDDIASKSFIRADDQFANDLRSVVTEAQQVLTDAQVKPIGNQIMDIAKKAKSGVIDGETYSALTKHGAPLDRAMSSPDPNIRHYASRVRDALDSALERSAPPELIDRLRQTRYQWKNMKTVEDLAETSPTGDVSPLKLLQKVRNSYSDMAYGGGGDLADLARIGQRFFKQPADSGTPLGNLILGGIRHYGLPAAALAAGGGAYAAGYEPKDIAMGAGGIATLPFAARGMSSVLNRPTMIQNAIQRSPLFLPPVKNKLLEAE